MRPARRRPRRIASTFAFCVAALAPAAGFGALTCKGRPVTLRGTRGADVLRGTAGDDVIHGRAGRDLIFGGGGNDLICGGSGDDEIHGERGDDEIHAGAGDDEVFGERGRDRLVGNRGDDRLDGGRGSDSLDGGPGADRLVGGRAADVADGGPGKDVCSGETTVDCLLGLRLELVADLPGAAGVAVSPPGDPRMFLVEQAGRVWLLEDGQLLAEPFLDLGARTRAQGEQGLLGLAFHPHFATNGRLFVSYTRPSGLSVLSELSSGGGSGPVSLATERVLLEVPQPAANHNGGMIAFGPDGFLYYGLGDGGFGGDPAGHGQNPKTLLGSILRLDVDGKKIAAPPDNPFVGVAGRDEIWAYGLRNPWRFSFDEPGGRLYIGDVGQSAREEIDAAPVGLGGVNYGWNRLEGRRCYQPASGCAVAGTRLPVIDIAHGEAGTCSVIGGYVYRGGQIPEIDGRYFYSDYCGAYLRSFLLEGGSASEPRQWLRESSGRPTSFGRDADGELYLAFVSGRVYRIVAVR